MKYIDLQLGKGEDRRKMNLFLSTTQPDIAIISTECPNPAKCDVPAPFDKKDVNIESHLRYETPLVRFFDKL